MMFSDKLAWGEAQARSQMSPLVHSLEIEFSNLAETLSLATQQLADSSSESKKEYSKSSPLSRFEMVANIKYAGEWNINKALFLEKSPTKTWAALYLSQLFKEIDAKEIKPGAFAAFSLLDPQRRTYLFVLHHRLSSTIDPDLKTDGKSDEWNGFLIGAEFFQSLMDRQKGQISSIFLVNNLGQALGHTTPEYVGNFLSEDPIVAELMKSQNGNGSGSFRDLKGEVVQGIYEQVAGSNVYAVITTPLSALLKNREKIRLQFVLMGLGLGFVGIAVFALLYRSDKKAAVVAVTPATKSAILAGAPVPKVNNFEEAQQEKMQAFLRIAAALSHELRGPMASILGHAQLLKSEGGGNEHLVEIEEQARKTRELAQKLMAFSGESAPQIVKSDLVEIVNRAIRNVEAKVFRKGVNVFKDLKPVAEVEIPAEMVTKAIENLLNNAIEAMERSLKKELRVSLSTLESGDIELKISDTGEGIEPQNIGRVFEPFFTTRGAQNHVGLGLSMALGILKELKGTVSIESERSKGTSVKVVLDPKQLNIANQKVSAIPQANPSSVLAPAKLPSPPEAVGLSVPIFEDKEAEAVLSIESVEHEVSAMPDLEERRLDQDQAAQLPSMPDDDFSEVPVPGVASLDSPPLPPSRATAAKVPAEVARSAQVSLKIDKPHLTIQKKTSVLDLGQFQIRKPGDKI